MSFKIGVPTLPSGYTQLEYIEGNGTQYINTSFVPTDRRISFNFKYFPIGEVPTMQTHSLCNLNSTSGASYSINIRKIDDNPIKYSDIFNILGINDSNIYINNFSSMTWEYTDYDEDIEGPGIYITYPNGPSPRCYPIDTFEDISDNTNPFQLLTSNGATRFRGQLYPFTYSENNVLKLNLIPAKRNSDSVVGMYDTVSNTFLTNADASGNNFIAGPEVSGGLVYKDIDSLRINSNGSYKRLTGLYKKDPDSSGYILVYSKTYAPPNYFCFTATSANATIRIPHSEMGGLMGWTNLQYSLDNKVTWNNYTWTSSTDTPTITLSNIGDKVYWRGINDVIVGENAAEAGIIATNGEFTGSLNTLLSYEDEVLDLTGRDRCFMQLFYSCESCTANIELPATTLSPYCYCLLFGTMGRPRITTPPVLPATTLAYACYADMFKWSEITAAPALPATTLAEWCYSEMFTLCQSLVTPPALPATTLAEGCYQAMFMGCTALYASDASITGTCDKEWKTPSVGIFTNTYNQSAMFGDPDYLGECAGTRASNDMAGVAGNSYTYYTLNSPVTSPDYFCFTATAANASIHIDKADGIISMNAWTNLLYSLDNKVTWLPYDGSYLTLPNIGDKVYWRGINTAITGQWGQGFYASNGKFTGNVNTLLDYRTEITDLTGRDYCFNYLFYNCYCDADINLPAMVLSAGCYANMFGSSRLSMSITTPPVLPATTLAENCYDNMFYGCSSLVYAPALPATTLADSCYSGMFNGCTSLQVWDASGSGHDKAWTIPANGTFTNTYAQTAMFGDTEYPQTLCPGTRSSSNMAGAAGQSYTYYTLNTPV